MADEQTQAALIEHLRESIGRLRQDLGARSDPLLDEVAHALGLLLDLASHAHQHAVDDVRRLDALEARR